MQAAVLLHGDLRTPARKVQSGRTLSTSERNLLQFLLAGGEVDQGGRAAHRPAQDNMQIHSLLRALVAVGMVQGVRLPLALHVLINRAVLTCLDRCPMISIP